MEWGLVSLICNYKPKQNDSLSVTSSEHLVFASVFGVDLVTFFAPLVLSKPLLSSVCFALGTVL